MGLRVVEIAEKCEVDRRTIYRDLTLLVDIGIPIHQREGRFFLDRENYSATIRLNFDETMALFLAARVAAFQEQPFNPHMPTAMDKLAQALPTPIAAHVKLIADTARKNAHDPRAQSVLETLALGWAERRKVKIWYSSNDDARPQPREFSVYFIEPQPSGAVRIVGFDSLAQRVRAISLARILRARLLPATYQMPTQYDARRYLEGSFAEVGGDPDERDTVILIFTSEARPRLHDRRWHGAQRVEILDDKRAKVTLQVGNWRDVLPWLRSWGSSVEVLEPAGLREECARDAARVMDMYNAAAR
jgi:predicted DNA-binding transcriptional regulator YafY